MPRLRFTRDERGYEHTFLVHTTGRRGRERSRVLYWFRSPPAVRVGRPPLDPEAIRAIEEANPAIAFDWAAILEARPADSEQTEGWRARRGRATRERETRESAPADFATRSVRLPDRRTGGPRSPEGQADRRQNPPAPPGAPVHADDPNADGEGDHVDRSAVHRALGSEGLVRVRARYAEVLARIASQVTDAAVADELRELAGRLNPDGWVTDEEVRDGLESFEPVLETVRRRLGRPRRRGAESQQDSSAAIAPADRVATQSTPVSSTADDPSPD